jgi:ABC-type glycerol-3-phosphate transport system permease component
MVGTAFKTLPEAMGGGLDPFPETWQWGNLPAAFREAPFGRYFFNSLAVSTVVGLAVVLTSLTAGFAFAQGRFRGRALLFGLVLATMMVPFELTFIPNFVLVSRLGWYNTYAALIVPWCANAFGIFLVRQAFRSLPQAYLDAAAIDGCGPLRFLRHVGIALVWPTLVTVFLFAFLGSYNALLWPLVVTSDPELRVVQVGLAAFVLDSGVRLNLLMCASAVVILPSVALFLGTQRYFESGTLQHGVKE